MHTFIEIGQDIFTLDTAAQRAEASFALAEAGIDRALVYRGGPDTAAFPSLPRRHFGADGQFRYDGMHSMASCYGGPNGLVS